MFSVDSRYLAAVASIHLCGCPTTTDSMAADATVDAGAADVSGDATRTCPSDGAPDPVVCANWPFEIVDADGDTGASPSLVLDSDGNAHVAYYDTPAGPGSERLSYATNASGVWIKETIDWGRVHRPALAVDSLGHAHIAYQPDGVGPSPLRYATNATGAWTSGAPGGLVIETNYLRGLAIVVDSMDHVHIVCGSYSDTGAHHVAHATNASGTWTVELIERTSGEVSMALGPGGDFHIAHVVGPPWELRYVTNASGTWQSEVVEPEWGGGAAIAATGAGVDIVYTVFFNLECGFYSELRHASLRGGTWTISVIVAGGAPADQTIVDDQLGHTHVAFVRGYLAQQAGRYATNVSGAWVVEAPAPFTPALFGPSLAIDASGRPWFATQARDVRDLLVGQRECP